MNSKHQPQKASFPMALLIISIACLVIFLAAKIFADDTTPAPKPPVTSSGSTTKLATCSPEVAEVCGEDGNTYRNACLAEKANMKNYTTGKCENKPQEEKPEEKPEEKSEGIKACTREYDPVCGDDGITYANSCLAEHSQAKIVAFGDCKPKTDEKTTKPENTNTEEKIENTTENSTPNLPSDATNTASASKLEWYDNSKFHHYKNTSVGYNFAIPKNTSYQGFGAQEWAAHTLAINTGNTELTDFASAAVKVYYYHKTPANPPENSEAVTLANGATVYISSNHSAGTDNIVNTIIASIEKN